nr:MAG TPA: hypothetical protein [Herelleviridae sp.]
MTSMSRVYTYNPNADCPVRHWAGHLLECSWYPSTEA